MMDTSKSKFFHFGILPQSCIHSAIEDEYSKMYVPRDKCDCGCFVWYTDDCTMILGYDFNGKPMVKDVHRCSECGDIRMADHIGVKDADI